VDSWSQKGLSVQLSRVSVLYYNRYSYSNSKIIRVELLNFEDLSFIFISMDYKL